MKHFGAMEEQRELFVRNHILMNNTLYVIRRNTVVLAVMKTGILMTIQKICGIQILGEMHFRGIISTGSIILAPQNLLLP